MTTLNGKPMITYVEKEDSITLRFPQLPDGTWPRIGFIHAIENDGSWTRVGKAEGVVEIPNERRIALQAGTLGEYDQPLLGMPNGLMQEVFFPTEFIANYSDSDVEALAPLEGLCKFSLGFVAGPHIHSGLYNPHPITDAGMSALSEHRDLTGLSISSDLITPDGLRVFANHPVKNLGFSGGSEVRPENIQFLIGESLESFAYVFNGAPAGPVDVLGQAPHLKRLELRSAGIQDSQLDVLELLTDLEVLDLAENKSGRPWGLPGHVGDRAAILASKIKSLTEVILGGTHVTDVGAASLAGLPDLRRLVLSGASLTGRGVANLATAQSLVELDLQFNDLSDAHFESIAQLPLRHLNVSNAELTTGSLAGLAQIESLESLEIIDNDIDYKEIGVLSSMPNLKEVRVTTEWWEEDNPYQKYLPGVRVWDFHL